jgi:hypothetical protein
MRRTDPKTISDKIEHWLLTSNIQVNEGNDQGGIAGWLNEDNQPEFVYMEITGYYLTCLAFIITKSNESRETAITRAVKALDWLDFSTTDGNMPKTRKYIAAEESGKEDWRNSAVFSFDIGMAIRGISTILPLLPGRKKCEPLSRLVEKLMSLCNEDHTLKSHTLLDQSAAQLVPDKWSTKPNIHQAKIAAAILSLPDEYLSSELKAVVDKLYTDWLTIFNKQKVALEELHPAFYFLEGLLISGAFGNDHDAISETVRLYEKLMDSQTVTRYLTSISNSDLPPLRSDVIAQALRVGCILASQGRLDSVKWKEKLSALAKSLMNFANADGSISFFPKAGSYKKYWNTWCAMFSYQALYFWDKVNSGRQIDQELVKFIV